MKDTNKKCQEILELLVKQGFTFQVGESEIDKAITTIRGLDPRTICNWKRALETLGYIQKLSAKLFKLDLAKTPELLTIAITREEEKRQTKLL